MSTNEFTEATDDREDVTDQPRHSRANDDWAWGDVGAPVQATQEFPRFSTAVEDSPDASDNTSADAERALAKERGDRFHRGFEDDEARRVELALVPIQRAESVTHAEAVHVDCVYRVQLQDGRTGYLKPQQGELPDLRPGDIPEGSRYLREVAACELDRLLLLHVVPDTVPRNEDDFGEASLQAEVPYEARPYDEYLPLDRQRMAVLDYVMANSDRHEDNYRTTADGRPAAIDNGCSFPELDNGLIVSSFVTDALGQPLDCNLLADLRGADRGDLAQELEDHRLAKSAVDGVLARLDEICTDGMITGRTWRGLICDDLRNRVR